MADTNPMDKDSLFAFYDLNVSHGSFDFLAFLTAAEVARRKRNFASLHVVFVPPPNREFRSVLFFSDHHENWRLHNLLIPACRLLSSIKQYTVYLSEEQGQNLFNAAKSRLYPDDYRFDNPIPPHSQGWNVASGHLGEDIQQMSASLQALEYAQQWLETHSKGIKAIVITIRESLRYPERNSDLLSSLSQSSCFSGA